MPYCSYLHNVKETKTFDSVVIQAQKGGDNMAKAKPAGKGKDKGKGDKGGKGKGKAC